MSADAVTKSIATVLNVAADALGNTPSPQMQRSVGRLLEGLGSILPDKSMQDEFVNYMRTSSPYPHLRSGDKFKDWLAPIKTILAQPSSFKSSASTSTSHLHVAATSLPAKAVTNLANSNVSGSTSFPQIASSSNPWLRTSSSSHVLRPLSETQTHSQKEQEVKEDNFVTATAHIRTRFIPTGGAMGTQGTPASYRLGVNRKHTKALQRLQDSAKRYKGVTHV